MAQLQLDLDNERMGSSHKDQEMKRLDAIIQAVAKVNPSQVKLILEMQPEFEFKDRSFPAQAGKPKPGSLESLPPRVMYGFSN